MAGFNPFFNDVNGAVVWQYAAALDHKLPQGLLVGAEYTHRDTDPLNARFTFGRVAFARLTLQF